MARIYKFLDIFILWFVLSIFIYSFLYKSTIELKTHNFDIDPPAFVAISFNEGGGGIFYRLRSLSWQVDTKFFFELTRESFTMVNFKSFFFSQLLDDVCEKVFRAVKFAESQEFVSFTSARSFPFVFPNFRSDDSVQRKVI